MNLRHFFQFGCTRFALLLGVAAVFASIDAGRSTAHPAQFRDDATVLRQPAEVASAKNVTISGGDGQLVGQIVTSGSTAAAWAVLTDYNNFAAFLPNVESSRLLGRNGNRVTFEQVNVLRVASLPIRNRVVVHATEQRPNQIQFTVMDGDDPVIQGVWQIQAAGSGQVAITHQVSLSGGVYSTVYRSELERTLTAFQREIERRS